MSKTTPHSCAETARIYRIPQWSDGYFQANTEGQLCYAPTGTALLEISRQLEAQELDLPVLVRFNDILRDRLGKLSQAFARAFANHGLDRDYTAIYPIKVNQQASVVNALLKADCALGLEAGSKAELLAVIGISPAGSTIVCNGYKDRDYLRLALIARAMGHQVYIVIEQPIELDYLFEVSEAMGIEPQLGVRVRLATIGKGKWQNTGGEKSKFGLTAAELYAVRNKLTARGKLHWLHLLHIHMGSQIAELDFIRQGVREACQFYIDLCRLGAQLSILDIGGGLGVDYEGSASSSEFSLAYSLDEYADAIVSTVHTSMQSAGLPVPDLMSESGRALTAHHAALIVEVTDVETLLAPTPEVELSPEDAAQLQPLRQLLASSQVAQESAFEQAESLIQQLYTGYSRGEVSLEARMVGEGLYYTICAQLDRAGEQLPAELRETLHRKLAYKYFCNLSIFQSLPDIWGIEQVFPIVPLQRLQETPDEYAVIHDLTCDSDGQIEHYACDHEYAHTLRVHNLREGERYLLGVFMIGAYQEILGDMHNLFGDTHAVNVELDAAGELAIVNLEEGDKADELLRYVHYDLDKLAEEYRGKLGNTAYAERHLQKLLASLGSYTYLTNR